MQSVWAILLLVIAAPGAMASNILISQPVISGYADLLNFGQSFTAPSSGDFAGIRLSVFGSFGGSEFTVRLHAFDRTTLAIHPVVLSVGVVPESAVPTSAAWIEIPMMPTAPLTLGNTYAFTIEATDPGGIETGWNNYGVTTDVYAGGELFGGLSGTATLSDGELAFEILVPEPRSGAMLLSGGVACALLAALRRRRRTGMAYRLAAIADGFRPLSRPWAACHG